MALVELSTEAVLNTPWEGRSSFVTEVDCYRIELKQIRFPSIVQEPTSSTIGSDGSFLCAAH